MFPEIDNPRTIDWFLVPLVLLAIILLGHYGLFSGHTFFAFKDSVITYSYGTKDEFFSGWRPDLAFGTTFFFGDPGLNHTWSLVRLWQSLFSNPVWGYNYSILFLIWLASLFVYFFLRRTIPGLNRAIVLILACLIPFCSLRHDLFFQRHWISLTISSALVSLTLYDFLRSPSYKHFYIYTLAFFSALFLGSSYVLFGLITFTVSFFLSYIFYHRLYKKYVDLWRTFKQFFLLNFWSGLCVAFLGAWVVYSFTLEASLTDYVRAGATTPDTFFNPQITPLYFFDRILNFFHAGLFAPTSIVLGIGQVITYYGENNVSPIFPLVLIIVLFQRSQNFWEFFAKFIILGYWFYILLLALVPGVTGLFPKFLYMFRGLQIFPAVHIYEILLLGIFIQRLKDSIFTRKPLEVKIVRGLVIGLSIIYGLLFILALGTRVVPEKLNFLFQNIFHWVVHRIEFGQERIEFFSLIISENIQLLHETMGWVSVIFYGLTFLSVICFSKHKFPGWFTRNGGIYFSLLVFVINLFLAWAIYPLNKEPLIWERQDFVKDTSPVKIRKYDRIAKVNAVERCGEAKNFIECAKLKMLEPEFGPKRWVRGFWAPPLGLDFSGYLSFLPKETVNVVSEFLERDGLNVRSPLRYLQHIPPYSLFRIYEFAGIKYFVSEYQLPVSENIKLVHSSFQFYLYQNIDAPPYFYLADRLERINEVEELYDSEKGVAYLWKDSPMPDFSGNNRDRNGIIEIKSFEFGEIIFRSSSKEKEFLVVADVWHPNWRAHIDGEEKEIIKTNGIFKGINLPPGNHTIRMYFDNEPYRPGIWISIFSWIIFIGSWYFFTKNTLAHRYK